MNDEATVYVIVKDLNNLLIGPVILESLRMQAFFFTLPMKDSNYVMVFAWMTKLNLSGNELLIFALIHGFSQDGESKFTGSSKYICDVLNIKSKTTVKNSIKSLIEKGYVKKTTTTINGITFNKYSANVFTAKGGAEIDPPSQKLPGGGAEIDRGGGAEIDPNINILHNNYYNKKDLAKNKLIFPFNGEEFKKIWAEWRDYKSKEHRFKYKSIQSEQAALMNLNNLSNQNESAAIKIIKQSMANGWKGFFELKNKYNGKSTYTQLRESGFDTSRM